LFWSMFLPLGAVWSADSRRKPNAGQHRIVSVASVAYLLQLAIVYWMAGWAKWSDAWLQGDALHDVFSFGLYSLPLGEWLAQHGDVTYLLSRGVPWFELAAPCLLFFPWQTARLRALLVVAFLLFHVGIALTVTVGLFSYVAMLAWLAVLPSEVWERLGAGARDRENNAGEIPPLAPPFEGGGYLAGLCGVVALAIVVAYNAMFAGLVQLPASIESSLRWAANATALHQAWAVFGDPPRKEWWYVYQVVLKDGRRLDLLSRSGGVDHERPKHPAQQFANHRWRKLHLRLPSDAGTAYRQPLAEYLCRRWNETHPPSEQIVRLDLYCYSRPLGDATDQAAYTREALAEVVSSEEGGNFAEALRDLQGL
jgi:hypothetical protein